MGIKIKINQTTEVTCDSCEGEVDGDKYVSLHCRDSCYDCDDHSPYGMHSKVIICSDCDYSEWRECAHCAKDFYAPQYANKKYCSKQCKIRSKNKSSVFAVAGNWMVGVSEDIEIVVYDENYDKVESFAAYDWEGRGEDRYDDLFDWEYVIVLPAMLALTNFLHEHNIKLEPLSTDVDKTSD